jgi:hypothetical protein
MKAQDTHEDIFVVGQVGHRLDVINMGRLQRPINGNHHPVSVLVHTSMYWYILVCTCMYWHIPLGIDTRCCQSSPTTQSRGPCVKYCVLSRNSIWPFHQSCLAVFDLRTQIRIGRYWYELACTGMYQYVPVHTSMYGYMLVCTGMS